MITQSISNIETLSDIPSTTLARYVKGTRGLSQKNKDKLEKWIKKFADEFADVCGATFSDMKLNISPAEDTERNPYKTEIEKKQELEDEILNKEEDEQEEARSEILGKWIPELEGVFNVTEPQEPNFIGCCEHDTLGTLYFKDEIRGDKLMFMYYSTYQNALNHK